MSPPLHPQAASRHSPILRPCAPQLGIAVVWYYDAKTLHQRLPPRLTPHSTYSSLVACCLNLFRSICRTLIELCVRQHAAISRPTGDRHQEAENYGLRVTVRPLRMRPHFPFRVAELKPEIPSVVRKLLGISDHTSSWSANGAKQFEIGIELTLAVTALRWKLLVARARYCTMGCWDIPTIGILQKGELARDLSIPGPRCPFSSQPNDKRVCSRLRPEQMVPRCAARR
jgi:hypothetical protein